MSGDHDNTPVGVTIYECDASSIFNNVLWNNGNVQILLSSCSGAGSAAVANVYNNIVDCTGGGACFGTDAKGALGGTSTSRTTSGSATAARSISHSNESNTVTLTATQANTQGYTAPNVYRSASGSAAGAGVNLTSVCAGDLAPLCKDMLGNPRPASGSWSAGAY
jgi:hypothetical protein